MAKKKSVKKAAPKIGAKKSAAKKGAKDKKPLGGTRMLPSQSAFSPNEIVQIIHDNDPQHTGCGGSVLCVDQNNIVQVKICSEGKELLRSYMPSQLKKLF